MEPYSQRVKTLIWIAIGIADLLMLWGIVATGLKIAHLGR